MSNYIKYNTSSESNALRTGDFHFGVGDVAKGPTESTGYWNGYTPPSGGYTIYLNKASNGPSIYAPSNDSELISLTNQISGESFASATECLNWYNTQNDKTVVNRDYETIITDGLKFIVDAGFTPSYSTSGTTLYDLSGNGFDGTLTNGPTFDSGNGGSIVFDGSDDLVDFGTTILNLGTQDMTISSWVKLTSNPSGYVTIAAKSYAGTGNRYFMGTNVDKKVALFIANTSSNTIPLGTTVLSLNTWYFITGVWDRSGNASIYINDTAETVTNADISTYSSDNITDNTIPFRIGSYAGTNKTSPLLLWPGNIATTMLYFRTLSSTEITQNFNAQKGRYGY
jgi:hypothetical protein